MKEAILSKVPMIAIVDDDESFRRATASFIRSLGYVAAAFGSAEAFLKSDRINDTDCVISDVQMPGMSGVELHKHLIKAGHVIPTILVTAYPDEMTRNRALMDGVVCYLAKPVDDDHLERCLGSVLDSGTHEENS